LNRKWIIKKLKDFRKGTQKPNFRVAIPILLVLIFTAILITGVFALEGTGSWRRISPMTFFHSRLSWLCLIPLAFHIKDHWSFLFNRKRTPSLSEREK
jgi:hypothetical protein